MKDKKEALEMQQCKLSKEEVDKYNEMVSNIESCNIYDGRGTFDLYECNKCTNMKITTYAVKGVTPFCMNCSCGGLLQHTKSFNSVPSYINVEKWIRPTLETLEMLSKGEINHVLNGGLLLESEIMEKHMSKGYHDLKEAVTRFISLKGVDGGLEAVHIPSKNANQHWKKRNKNSRL